MLRSTSIIAAAALAVPAIASADARVDASFFSNTSTFSGFQSSYDRAQSVGRGADFFGSVLSEDFEDPAYAGNNTPVNGWDGSFDSLFSFGPGIDGTSLIYEGDGFAVPDVAFSPVAAAPITGSFDFQVSFNNLNSLTQLETANTLASADGVSFGLINTRVFFETDGTVDIFDADGLGGVVLVEEIATYVPGTVYDLSIVVPGDGSFEFLIDGVSLYTGTDIAAAVDITGAASGIDAFAAVNDNNFTGDGYILDNFNPIPEPTSLALLGMGGLAALRRRRA